jgi:hypothetical protein
MHVRATVVAERLGNVADTHDVIFNRGVAGSQAYSRLFRSRPPADVEDGAAFKWLSRGLEEALLAFIGAAADSTFALHAA